MGVFDYYTVFSIRFQVVKVRDIEFAAKNICSYCFYYYIIFRWLWQAAAPSQHLNLAVEQSQCCRHELLHRCMVNEARQVLIEIWDYRIETLADLSKLFVVHIDEVAVREECSFFPTLNDGG